MHQRIMAATLRRVWPASGLFAASGSALALRGLATQASWVKTLNASLDETDPVLFDILEHEKRRQRESICLIPSEVKRAI
jgi:glycine hydroxymethyltransferase